MSVQCSVLALSYLPTVALGVHKNKARRPEGKHIAAVKARWSIRIGAELEVIIVDVALEVCGA
jgi:hypothetical protein